MSTKTYTSLTDFQKDYHYDLSDKSTHLGEGSYGQVVKAYDNENNKWVALKIGKDLMKEYEAAQRLNHRNIAKYEACYRINDRNIGQQDYAIMQLYKEGNLATLLKTTTLTEQQRLELVRGILEGLQYLHTQQCIHRDLKPANILISRLPDGNFRPLLADFGLVKVIKEDDFIQTAGSDVVLSDGRGTAVYKSPEQIAGETAHYNLDLWAFGVILYEIMTGERPFKRGTTGSDVRDANILFDQIKNVKIPTAINTIAEPYQAIIRRCLVKDIHKRVRKESELLGMLDETATDPKFEEPTDTKKAEEKTDVPPKQEKNSESSKIHKIEYSDDTRNIPNLGIRLLAYVIDIFFVILLNATLLLIIEIRIDSDFISLFNFISFYFYFFICELLWRKSLGKWLFNLKVVVGQTNTSVFIRLLVRTLVRLIPFEALTIFFNKGKCLHDILSKTQVIQRKGSI